MDWFFYANPHHTKFLVNLMEKRWIISNWGVMPIQGTIGFFRLRHFSDIIRKPHFLYHDRSEITSPEYKTLNIYSLIPSSGNLLMLNFLNAEVIVIFNETIP